MLDRALHSKYHLTDIKRPYEELNAFAVDKVSYWPGTSPGHYNILTAPIHFDNDKQNNDFRFDSYEARNSYRNIKVGPRLKTDRHTIFPHDFFGD